MMRCMSGCTHSAQSKTALVAEVVNTSVQSRRRSFCLQSLESWALGPRLNSATHVRSRPEGVRKLHVRCRISILRTQEFQTSPTFEGLAACLLQQRPTCYGLTYSQVLLEATTRVVCVYEPDNSAFAVAADHANPLLSAGGGSTLPPVCPVGWHGATLFWVAVEEVKSNSYM